MGIQLISGFDRLQSYYKAADIQTVTPEEVKKQELQPEIQQKEKEIPDYSAKPLKQGEDNRKRTTDLENVSLTFHKEDSFDYIGSESGLANLDMQKAISDMKRDEVLQEYQYFVGSAQNFMEQGQDGLVLQKLIAED